MAIRSFYRGSSTLSCRVCGRTTRDTGDGDICAQCFALAGIENEISDGYCTEEARVEEIRGLLKQLANHGGPITDWLNTFPLVGKA